MGMRKKDRIRLMRRELLRYYYIVPIGLALMSGVVFTACVFHARMYTFADIEAYMWKLLPFVTGYLMVNTLFIFMTATIYAKRMEGSKNDGNS